MKPPITIWKPSDAKPLQHPLLNPIIGRVLAARGLDLGGALSFVSAAPIIHDPRLLNDMDKGMKLLKQALDKKWLVCVYLDCDADGLSSGALMIRALRAMGFRVIPQIADRLNGFGIKPEALKALHAQGVKLVITTDTGSDFKVWKDAPRGLRRIVTDHHLPDHDKDGNPMLPKVDAWINPKAPANRYPFVDLCGAGMALKFIQATQLSGFPRIDGQTMEKLEALATIGTTADMMPLIDENLSLVRRGIEALSHNALTGIAVLREVTKWKPEGREDIAVPAVEKTKDITFGFASIINAAGRRDKSLEALTLLVTDDHVEATLLAEQLKQNSDTHAQSRRQVYEAAKEIIAAMPDDLPAIPIVLPPDVQGPVGAPASRIAFEFKRDTLLVKRWPQDFSGSARSRQPVGGDVMTKLEKAQKAGLAYGVAGHKGAVAFSVLPENWEQFAAFIQDETRKEFPNGIPPTYLTYDYVLHAYELTPNLWSMIAPLSPFGIGNPEPILAAKDVKVLGLYMDREKPDPNKVKLMLRSGFDSKIYAKVRGRPEITEQLKKGSIIDLLFTVEKNSYNSKVELILVDWRHSPMKKTPDRQLDPIDL